MWSRQDVREGCGADVEQEMQEDRMSEDTEAEHRQQHGRLVQECIDLRQEVMDLHEICQALSRRLQKLEGSSEA